MTQLAAQFEQLPEVRYGLTAMCVGLGQGGSVVWENPHFDGKKGKFDQENTGFGWRTEATLDSYVASQPTSCQMKRPGK